MHVLSLQGSLRQSCDDRVPLGFRLVEGQVYGRTVCEALCDSACKKGFTNTFRFDFS